ncbi:putative polypeptide N-acetylgalactosaminyltransferase 10 isoform X3 [Parasteatoda tepidariorum]|uniref:putative polypeptide N-acetylgalactosaminyltransferase 10 isoform X3 n=1 Tax=Parasteatoda tepidariorum TaxID=114398 RepID=UPI0039BCF0CA
MARRYRTKVLKFILTICVFCGVFFLKTVRTPIELVNPSILPQIKDPLKKSWYDVKEIPHGPGEQGLPFYLPSGFEKFKHELYKENGFNALVSDFISLNRTLPDIRHPSCKTKLYLSILPKVSLVIPFHNEHWSTLLRTVTSVLNRSPVQIIQEIILVDDFSTKAQLKAPLDSFVKKHSSIIHVIRAKKREGLIRARLLGAKKAVGDILVFLDSHTEVNIDWLPPLIEPIAINRKTVACPFIDVIDYETLAYRAQDEGARGSFDWELYYKRLPLLPEDLKHPADPFKSPVMAGGLFAIDRMFFWNLGGYDKGLDVWGGEQYELSFKIWQCGGQMFDVPCSRVGHIYRKFAPFPNPGLGDFVGRIRSVAVDLCIDTKFRKQNERFGLDACIKDNPNIRGEQQFVLSWHKDIRPIKRNICFDVSCSKKQAPIVLWNCHGMQGNQLWKYDLETQHLIHLLTNTCLDCDVQKKQVFMNSCDSTKRTQSWRFEIINSTAIFNW